MNKMRFLLATAVMLLAAILWWRLDVNVLHTAIEKQTSRLSGSRLEVRTASLSLIHGIGLRLDHVTFNVPGLSMQAEHMNITVHLLPLLFGKVEMDSLDIHDAHIKLGGSGIAALSASFASLPFERIELFRSTIDDAAGVSRLGNLHLDVRDIGLNSKTLLEVSARQKGYALQGHAQLLFRAGAVMSGFGKVTMKSIPAALLVTVAPAMLTKWLSRQHQLLTGSLTMDITRGRGWSLFGEIEARDNVAAGSEQQEQVRLRGKISHPAEGELVWHDSFIHLQGNAVIALDGHCLAGRCESRLDARNVPVKAWIKLLPDAVSLPLAGNTRLTGMLHWHDDIWQATGKLGLNHLSFLHEKKMLSLPDMQLIASALHGNSDGWTGQALMSFPGLEGNTHVQAESNDGLHAQKKGWQIKLASGQLADGVWQPLGNLLLSHLHLAPELTGSGSLQAEVVLQRQPGHSSLQFDFDAGKAVFNYGKQWLKPGGVAGRCRTSIDWQSHISQPDTVQLNHCVLGASQLDHLEYRQGKKLDSLKLAGLRLDLNDLRDKKLGLPAWLQLYRGRVDVDQGGLVWRHNTDDLVAANGQWKLQQMGTPGWQLTGSLKALGSVVSSDHLGVSGRLGQADLKGSFRLPTQRGWVDVLNGHLNWQMMPALPALWSDLRLSGKLHRMDVNIADYQWQNIVADYQFSHGLITLEHGKVGFAGGEMKTDELMLEPAAGILRIHGKVKARNVRLEQMPWMSGWLQANISGRMQANIELKGMLPVTGIAAWQRSNGDVTVYSGAWSPYVKQGDLKVKDSGKQMGAKRATKRLAKFKKLKFRFKVQKRAIEVSNIHLTSHGNRYRGAALVAADGAMSGSLSSGKKSYVINGVWPHPRWRPRQ